MSRPVRRVGGVGRWLLTGLLTASAACSGAPRPPAEPPPPTAPASAPPPALAAAQPQPPEPRVVIEPTEPEAEAPPTLAEAAQRERQRRRRTGEPIAVINDTNLKEHAVGQLTFMEDDAEAAAAGGAEAAGAEAPDEQYWRQRILAVRQRLAEAATAVPELEEKVAELRRRFYEADDAYYRDSRIKPAWDRTIDQVAQARATVEALRSELEVALEEGRRAGALPGWLREGIDLVPPEPEPKPETYEPGEPVIVEAGEGGGGS